MHIPRKDVIKVTIYIIILSPVSGLLILALFSIKKVIYEFETKADKMIENKNDELANKMFGISSDPNRALFSEETTKKILSHIGEEATSNVSE